MSSEDPIRQVPDELFRKISAKAERGLPDALFGSPPAPQSGAQPEPTPTASSDDAAESEDNSESAASATDPATPAGTVSVRVTDTDTGDLSPPGPELEGSGPSVCATDTELVSAAREVTEWFVSRAESRDSSVSGESVVPAGGGPHAAGPEDGEPSDVVAGDDSAVTVNAGDGASGDVLIPEPDSAPIETDTVGVQGDSSAPNSVAAESVASESAAAVLTHIAGQSVESDDLESGGTRPPRPVLLVIADSLAHYGPNGGLPADDPRIWPNLVAAELDWDVELVARIGWTCRDAYWALISDPRVWAAVPRAGAVVFAVGGMDSLPSPLPTALRESLRYLRPPRLRRLVRKTYNRLQPVLSKIGWPVALPPKVAVSYLERSRVALRELRPDLPIVGTLPPVHNSPAYGKVHRGRKPLTKALQTWSADTSTLVVDLAEAVRENIFSENANPDGIHWGYEAHSAVATAMLKTLQETR